MTLNKILKSSVFVGIASLLVVDSAFAQRSLRTRGSRGGVDYKAPSERVGVGGGVRQLPSEAREGYSRYETVMGAKNGEIAGGSPAGVDIGSPELSSEFDTSLSPQEVLDLRSATGSGTFIDPIIVEAESIVEIAQLDPNVTKEQLDEFVNISIAAGEWDPSAQENFLIFAENLKAELETQAEPNVIRSVENVSLALGLKERSLAKRAEEAETCSMFGLRI